jgi:hypothetical protein
LLIALVRTEDNIEDQLQHYLNIRKHVDSYDTNLQKELENLEQVAANDLLKKLSILLAFDFEAAVRLRYWDGLPTIILKSNACKCMKLYALMADCILSSEAPADSTHNTIRCIRSILTNHNSRYRELKENH